MNIISIDASTKSTGVAIFKHNQLVYTDCIKSSSSDLFNRINIMVNKIQELLNSNPDLEFLILEEVRPDNFMNNKTHKALMYLQGCLMMMIHNKFKYIKTDFLYPSEWRKVCQIKQGRGIQRSQQKQHDIQWVKKKFNIEVNDDIADAIGIGYAYLNK